MRDALLRRLLGCSGNGDNIVGVERTLSILDWVCNPLVADAQITDVIDSMEETGDLHPEDVIDGLADAVTGEPVVRCLRVMATELVNQTAAAARKLDRLCKAELKERGVSPR